MPAISLDKHNCLFSIVTMSELKKLPGAPDGGQTRDKAVPAQPQPHHSCLEAQNSSSLLLPSDKQGKTLTDKTHLHGGIAQEKE